MGVNQMGKLLTNVVLLQVLLHALPVEVGKGEHHLCHLINSGRGHLGVCEQALHHRRVLSLLNRISAY